MHLWPIDNMLLFSLCVKHFGRPGWKAIWPGRTFWWKSSLSPQFKWPLHLCSTKEAEQNWKSLGICTTYIKRGVFILYISTHQFYWFYEPMPQDFISSPKPSHHWNFPSYFVFLIFRCLLFILVSIANMARTRKQKEDPIEYLFIWNQ